MTTLSIARICRRINVAAHAAHAVDMIDAALARGATGGIVISTMGADAAFTATVLAGSDRQIPPPTGSPNFVKTFRPGAYLSR
jgi:hypothetical protein